MNTKTYMAKTGEVAQRWYVVDATDKVLGRMAKQLAARLQGKHKPEYTPHVDTGDFIVVINVEKMKLTGASKLGQKTYQRFSRYPDGLKETSLADMIEQKPEYVLTHAVKGMMPRSTLAMNMLKKLKVYRGSEHPHQAQAPEALEL